MNRKEAKQYAADMCNQAMIEGMMMEQGTIRFQELSKSDQEKVQKEIDLFERKIFKIVAKYLDPKLPD